MILHFLAFFALLTYKLSVNFIYLNSLREFVVSMLWLSNPRSQRIFILLNIVAVLSYYFSLYFNNIQHSMKTHRNESNYQQINNNINRNASSIENNDVYQQNQQNQNQQNFEIPRNRFTDISFIPPFDPNTSFLRDISFGEDLSIFERAPLEKEESSTQEEEFRPRNPSPKSTPKILKSISTPVPNSESSDMDYLSLSTFLESTTKQKKRKHTNEKEDMVDNGEEEEEDDDNKKGKKQKNHSHYLIKDYRDLSYKELLDSPSHAFEGISSKNFLIKKFPIKTIRQLANWKYYQLSKCICELAEVEQRDGDGESLRSDKSVANINHGLKKDYEKLSFNDIASSSIM